jgi:hypothetical protein
MKLLTPTLAIAAAIAAGAATLPAGAPASASPAAPTSASTAAAPVFDEPAHVIDGTKRFDQTSWLTAHNAYNNIWDAVPNQSWTTREQLDRGVRGLMLDLKPSGDAVELCHSSFGCAIRDVTLSDELDTVVLPFLRANPRAIVSLHFEIADGVSEAHMAKALGSVPGLGEMTFDPSRWNTQNWPTLQQIADSGQRLLMFADKTERAGDYQTGGSRPAHVMATSRMTAENHWSIGATIGKHDFTCRPRSSSVSLTPSTVSLTGKSWSRLFTMNHFHDAGEASHANVDNRFDTLQERDRQYCRPAAQRAPNFLALDFVNAGDAHSYIGVLNQGGMVMYEGKNASQDVVCGVPGQHARAINFKQNDGLGCENDEASSAKIVDAKAGMRFVVFDNEDGKTTDDWTEIDVLTDRASITINSFATSYSNSDVRVTAHPNNGIDGKVSRVEVASRVTTDPGEPEKPEPPAPDLITARVHSSTDTHGLIAGTGPVGAMITVTAPDGSVTNVGVPESGQWLADAYYPGTGSTWTARVSGRLNGASIGEKVLVVTRKPSGPVNPTPPDPCQGVGAQWDPTCNPSFLG